MSTLPIPTDKLFKTMALGGITIIGGTIALLAFAYISKRSAESEYLRANAALKRENVLYDTASESAQLEQQGIQRDQQCVSDEADDAKKEHSNVSSLLDHEISLVTSEAACAQTPEEKLAVIEKIRRLVDELYSCQAKAIRKSRERVARMQQLLESYSRVTATLKQHELAIQTARVEQLIAADKVADAQMLLSLSVGLLVSVGPFGGWLSYRGFRRWRQTSDH